MYVLEYTTNPKIMEMYGPKYAVSLLTMKPVVMEKTFHMSRNGNMTVLRTPEGDGFQMKLQSITVESGKYVYRTANNTYIFRKIEG